MRPLLEALIGKQNIKNYGIKESKYLVFPSLDYYYLVKQITDREPDYDVEGEFWIMDYDEIAKVLSKRANKYEIQNRKFRVWPMSKFPDKDLLYTETSTYDYDSKQICGISEYKYNELASIWHLKK